MRAAPTGKEKWPFPKTDYFTEEQLRAYARDCVEAIGPIDMVLHCPKCGKQHIDAPEWVDDPHDIEQGQMRVWDNPPHRSHLCHGCGHVWRPADVPTNGVAAVKTRGKADSPISEAGGLQGAFVKWLAGGSK